MKKIIALSLLVLLVAVSAYAGVINAGAAITGAGPGGTPSVNLGKLSTNVSLNVIFDTTAYAAATKHLSGNRAFGTSYNDTKIYYQEVAVGTGVSGVSNFSASDSSNFTSGWVSL